MRKTGAASRRGFLLFLLLAAIPRIGYAQETAEPARTAETATGAETAATEESAISEERQNEIDRIEMELKISTLLELAEWCRDLGLSDAGTKDALITRLRTALAVPSPAPEEEGAQVIVIESARTTEYFSVSEVSEDYARLSGGVVVKLKDKTATYKISAWEMLYNRTRNILSATGGVEYLKENGDTRETFRGESITMNLDTWAGMFIDSVSEKSIAGGDTAYRFTGAIISQNGEEVNVLRNAKITNAKTDEPYWNLTASRLWLLPGTDWALLSGVLKVGEIPVLWLPAFFWPSDEFIFHPVVGTRAREGAFFQTTTYIWGKAKADPSKESSISKIMGSGADMEKERQGLFLRTTGRKSTGADSKRWSISFDGYSNLGFYLGTDLVLPAKDHFGATNLSAGLGISRNVYLVGTGVYNPYAENTNNVNLNRDWNTSRLPLIPINLPFRYRFKIDGSYTAPFASFRWNFPLYSDPFIDRDFYLNRSETFDWFTLIKGDTEEENTLTTPTLGNYSWTVSANSTVPVKAVAPYISSLTLSNLSTTLEFASKKTDITDEMRREDPKIEDHLLYTNSSSPNYPFYYPSKWTAYSLSGSIAGTPLTLGNRDTSVPTEEESIVLNKFGAPRPPWAEVEKNATTTASRSSDISPRPLSQIFGTTKDNGLRFTTAYSFTPSSATELTFLASEFKRREDIDFTDIKNTHTRIRTDGSTTFTLAEPNNGLFSTSFMLTGYTEWQKSKIISKDETDTKSVEEQQAETDEKNYKATQFNSVYRFNTNIKPLYWHEIFSASTITYTLEGKFLRWEFDPASYSKTTPGDPAWNFIKGEWTREDISSHNTGINLNASLFDKTQTLSLSASLPPLFQNYSYTLTLRAWISETSVSGSYRETLRDGQSSSMKDPKTDMKIQPHTFTETLTFGTGKTLRQTIVYDPDPEYEYFTSAVTALSLDSLSAQYTASRVREWQYDKTNGWTQDSATEPTFNPVSFTLGYNPTLKQDSVFKNMLSYNIGITSSLSLDLLRYNFSRFTLGLNVKATVTRFMDISLSFLSENASIYRYLQNIPGFQIEGADPIVGETNILKDLADSFNFFDMDKRRNSGFKMKNLNLSLTHHLGDWDAVLDVKLSPYKLENDNKYQFNTEIAFTVRWIPISEIKTEITYNEKTGNITQK
jgi:hypothetical protein